MRWPKWGFAVTSEVCLMNRGAVVLAADSATTVTSWTGTARETRYFKGANKIHQLTDSRPVALMIFDSADLFNVPWEVVVKAFRAEFGNTPCDALEGYAQAFFEFLERDKRLFPDEVQREEVFRLAKLAAWRLSDKIVKDTTIAKSDWTTRLDDLIGAERTRIDALPLSHGLAQAEADMAVAAWRHAVEVELVSFITAPDEALPTDFGTLAELVLWTVIREPESHFSTTGVVVAGFGEHDVFPGHIHYVSSGLVAGTLLVREEAREAITHSNPADLSAFAQRGMIDTFRVGLDLDVYIDAIDSIDAGLDKFAIELAAESGGDLGKVANLPEKRTAARKSIVKEWLEEARKKHAYPLARVLAALPIPELAELAETLVNLQSLKEKVTKPSEEVGGPTDVAVITKSEGLIWIKRKHFFNANLNPRYMARLNGLYR